MALTKETARCLHQEAEREGRAGLGPARWQRLFAHIQRWRQLRRERLQLWSLSDATLKDIGLSRADVTREARRPFWDHD
ncbi:hypothetical protein GCM10027040_16160 [Halomonas shantousis]